MGSVRNAPTVKRRTVDSMAVLRTDKHYRTGTESMFALVYTEAIQEPCGGQPPSERIRHGRTNSEKMRGLSRLGKL